MRRPIALLILLLSSGACDAGGPAPTPAPGPAPAAAPTVAVVPLSLDAHGEPRTFVAVGRQRFFGTPEVIARAHLAQHANALNVSPATLGTLEVVRVQDTGSGGIVTTLRPRVVHIEVVGNDTRVLTRRDGSLVMISGTPHPGAQPGILHPFSLLAVDALAQALTVELGGSFAPGDMIDVGSMEGGYRAYRAPTAPLVEPSRVKAVLTPADGPRGNVLVPAYFVEVLRETAAEPGRRRLPASTPASGDGDPRRDLS